MTVGIVGGGVTGLALTHHLDRRGVDSVVLEADAGPGGVVESRRVDGRVLELGPQRLRRTDPVDDLVDDLGLGDEVIEAGETGTYVYADGALGRAPFTPEEFVTTDLLSWRAKGEVFGEPETESARPDETAAALFTRKFGEEAYRNLLGPLFGGIYGSDPARMPVRHALSGLVALEERYDSLLEAAVERAVGGERSPAISFEDGVQRLPEALYDANDERVHLETPVTAVGEANGGYALETPDETFAVDEVVVTTPADVTADLLTGIAPGANRLVELTYNPLALVYLLADCDRDGFGYQVGLAEDLRTLGVSWNASMFGRGEDSAEEASGTSSCPTGREGVYTCFLGGMDDPQALDESDEELGRIAAEEFEAVTDCEATALDVSRLRRGFPAYDASWDALDDLETPQGVHLATNYTGRMGVPSRIREAKRLSEELSQG